MARLTRHRGAILRLFGGVAAVVVVALALNFVFATPDPSAKYFPDTRIVSDHAVPADISLTTATGPSSQLKAPAGPVSRPNSILTPGEVAIKDVATVCKDSKHVPRISVTNQLIPVSEQLAVFQEYRISPTSSKHYGLDFLVPLQLGGSTSIKNVWPISTTKGVGFNEKELLNVRMHILVCHGEMPLTQAQSLMASDWVSLYVRYGG